MSGPREPDDLAQRYASWRTSTRGVITERLELAAVLNVLGPLRGKRVLDAGCGDGGNSIEFASRGAKVTGVDLSAPMLALARQRSTTERIEVEWQQGDITTLAAPDESFDLVVALTVLCLVSDPRRVVRELSRVLAPGGRLVIGELHRWSLWAVRRRVRGWAGDTFWRGARFWSVRALRELMADSGLEPGRARGVVYYPPVGLLARMLAPVDPYLARLGTLGAAFLVVEGRKPV